MCKFISIINVDRLKTKVCRLLSDLYLVIETLSNLSLHNDGDKMTTDLYFQRGDTMDIM